MEEHIMVPLFWSRLNRFPLRDFHFPKGRFDIHVLPIQDNLNSKKGKRQVIFKPRKKYYNIHGKKVPA